MRPVVLFLILIAAAHAPDSFGEVTDAAPNGFTLVTEVTIDSSRADVWKAAIDDVGQWWNDDHTISGDAGRLNINAQPLGCFCESLGEQGSVVHLVVSSVNHQVILRMTGGLGPLGLMGANGNMTWELFDSDDGTRVMFVYAVGGYHEKGLDSFAAAVDAVVGDALLRLKAYVETGDADNARRT